MFTLAVALVALAAEPKPAEKPAAAADAGAPAKAEKADAKAAPAEDAAHPDSEVADFTPEVKLLFRVVACEGDYPLPANIDQKVLDEHCKELKRRADKYKKTWVEIAEPFIQALKPAGLPKTVVYPFGGGDLISALTTYPEATDYTTFSLEHAGDPRRIHNVDAAKLKASLSLIRFATSGLLVANDSKTENLQKTQRGDLPGQLSFFLIGLAVHGYEPVALHYIRVDKDGKPTPLTWGEIRALDKETATLFRKEWVSPDFSPAFDNLEIIFQKKGGGEQKVHRHFAEDGADYPDKSLSKDPNAKSFGTDLPLQKYFENKGPVCAMTKAASYLLWLDKFSKVRDYLLNHMVWMISDSTGVPHSIAVKAGFEQDFYGHFDESFLKGNPEYNKDFKALWKKAKPLPFRYGYLDAAPKLQVHMMVTYKAGQKQPEAPAATDASVPGSTPKPAPKDGGK
jgi:hypothetical protein